MCAEGVCAHGSGILAAAESTFPHDSKVFLNAERTRMCNTAAPAPAVPGRAAPRPRDPTRASTSSAENSL